VFAFLVAARFAELIVSPPQYQFRQRHLSSLQLTVGVALDRSATKEREQLIVQTLWVAVAPNLIQTEVKNLDFAVLSGKIAAQVEHKGTKIYQRLLLM
jgi:hypothetical protein